MDIKTPYDTDNPRYNGLPPHIWQGLRAAFLQGYAAGRAAEDDEGFEAGFYEGWDAALVAKGDKE
jgi:hypothetical protein